MDWLIQSKADIHCRRQGLITFLDRDGVKVQSHGKSGSPQLKLVKASSLLKGLKKCQAIYVVKLNPIDAKETDWLSEYSDVFQEESTEMPPKREVDHERELLPGAQPIAKRAYKMPVLPEAIELKEQLR